MFLLSTLEAVPQGVFNGESIIQPSDGRGPSDPVRWIWTPIPHTAPYRWYVQMSSWEFLERSGEYIFVKCPKLKSEREEKSKNYFWTHMMGWFFLLQGHYLQGLKIGSQTWSTSKNAREALLGYLKLWIPFLLLGWSGWRCKVLPKHQKKGEKFGGYSEFLGFSDFLSFTRLHFCGPARFVEGVEIQKNRSCAAHRLQISRRSAYHHPNHPTVCWVFECFLRDVCHTWFGEDFPKKHLWSCGGSDFLCVGVICLYTCECFWVDFKMTRRSCWEQTACVHVDQDEMWKSRYEEALSVLMVGTHSDIWNW